MGNFDMSSSVSFEKAIENIEDGIERGIAQSADELAKIGKDAARSDIRDSGSVYNRETIEGFVHSYSAKADGSVTLLIQNQADHSGYLDRGVSGIYVRRNTRHSYTNKKPPLPPLIRWVQSELGGWKVNGAGTGLVPADD